LHKTGLALSAIAFIREMLLLIMLNLFSMYIF